MFPFLEPPAVNPAGVLLARAAAEAELPPAVPPYSHDPETASRLLGQAYLYIAQLSAELHRRAVEVNDLDDRLKAATARVAELEQRIAGGL